ncbi:MAG: Clp protease N-terminal domain-containing protein, partial [Bacteroidota bacterium]
MNLSNYTVKAAEVIQQSQQVAFNNANANIETEHILKSLLMQDDSPIDYLLKKNSVNLQQLEIKLDQQLEKLPKVSGGEPAQNISRDANSVTLRAGAVLKQFNDEFITPEHLLLALVQGNDSTAKLLKDFGLS